MLNDMDFKLQKRKFCTIKKNLESNLTVFQPDLF